MQLRNIWGGELFRYEAPDTGVGAPPAPGAGEAAPEVPQQSSPGTQPVAEQEPPGPIPYARFKEVNDARRELEERYQPYQELEELGYPVADLQRLTTWEQEYMQDPVGVWLRQAEQIDSLPAEVKAVIAAHAAGGTQGSPQADGAPPRAEVDQPASDEPPEWARPLIEDHQTRQEREQAEAISSFYDGLVSAWKELDKTQEIVTPDEAIHAHLAAASPQAASAEELLRTARETWLAVRSATLGTVVVPGRVGTVPQTVPGGGGAGASAPPVKPKTLLEARKLALADPQITGA